MMLFLLLVATTMASPLESSEPVAPSEVALAGEEGADREGKCEYRNQFSSFLLLSSHTLILTCHAP